MSLSSFDKKAKGYELLIKAVSKRGGVNEAIPDFAQISVS